jgi:hypothetical protein
MIQSTASASLQPDVSAAGRARSAAQVSKPEGSRSEASGKSTLEQSGQLSPEEQQQVAQLKAVDRKVRAHEQAHLRVGADLVRGGATFTYQLGPDNQRYAVAGEVSIDVTPARTPEKTIPKAQHIRATALAPVDPSAEDRSVAALASRMEGEARIEVAAQQRESVADTDRETSLDTKLDAGLASGAEAASDTQAIAEQGAAGFYREVAQSDGQSSAIGASFDSFA